jgi:diguanylate cyclase
MTEHEDNEPLVAEQDPSDRRTPADIVEAAILEGRITADNDEDRDALRIVVAAARQSAILHQLLKKRDDEIGQLTEINELDPLTMTFNRHGFNRRLEETIRLVERGNRATDPQALVVLMLDSDDFKQVNDTFGHLAGDELLWDTGARMWLAVRAEDTVARLGGDEFGILLPVTRGNEETIRDDALSVMDEVNERLRLAIEAHNLFEPDERKHIRMSAGAVIVERGKVVPINQIMHDADSALYAAKRAGKGVTLLHQERKMAESESWLRDARRKIGGWFLRTFGGSRG